MRAIIVILATAFCLPAFSQLKRGTVLISGSSNLGTLFGSYKEKSEINENPEATKTFAFNLQPKVGLFVARKLALGLTIDWQYDREKTPTDALTANTTILVGPFVRYYVETGNRELKFFAEASGGIGNKSVTTKNDPGNSNQDYSMFFMNAGPGMAFFINDRICLDLMVDYKWLRQANKNSDTEQRTIYKNFGVNLGFSLIL